MWNTMYQRLFKGDILLQQTKCVAKPYSLNKESSQNFQIGVLNHTSIWHNGHKGTHKLLRRELGTNSWKIVCSFPIIHGPSLQLF